MLLIGEILANAARVAPDAVAATLDDDALTFGEIDTDGEPHRATGSPRHRDRARRPGAVVGRHLARGGPGVRGAGQDRRGVRAAERRGRRSRSSRPSPSTPRPRLLLARPRTPRRGGRARRRASASRSSADDPDAAPTSPPSDAGSTSATRTSSSSRAGARAGPRASCSRTARTGCARSSARPRRRAAAGPCACSRSSTWRAGRSRSAPGRRGGRCTSCASPTPRRCCDDRRPGTAPRGSYCIPAVWARVLEHGVGAYDLSSLVEADTGTSATPPELLHAIKDALPHTVTRVFYGSTEAGPGAAARRRRPVAQAGQRRRRAAGRRRAARRARARCACAARS